MDIYFSGEPKKIAELNARKQAKRTGRDIIETAMAKEKQSYMVPTKLHNRL